MRLPRDAAGAVDGLPRAETSADLLLVALPHRPPGPLFLRTAVVRSDRRPACFLFSWVGTSLLSKITPPHGSTDPTSYVWRTTHVNEREGSWRGALMIVSAVCKCSLSAGSHERMLVTDRASQSELCLC